MVRRMFRICIPLAGLMFISVTSSAAEPDTDARQSAEFQRGRQLYARHCLICHMNAGQGVPGTYPPLAKSDLLRADRERAIRILCEGLSGPIEVNGRKYNNVMPAAMLKDRKSVV